MTVSSSLNVAHNLKLSLEHLRYVYYKMCRRLSGYSLFEQSYLITLGTTLSPTMVYMAHVNAHAYTGVIGSGSITPTEVYVVVLRKT